MFNNLNNRDPNVSANEVDDCADEDETDNLEITVNTSHKLET